jgi:hypothetical protein
LARSTLLWTESYDRELEGVFATQEEIAQALQSMRSNVEHDGAKVLIAELAGSDPLDEFYDAKMTLLCEQIITTVFPRANG